jgi:hypothetical protein
MVGIVIGTRTWNGVAHAAASRMAEMTGLRMEVIAGPHEQFVHPSWLKCTVLDRPEFQSEDSFFFMDADIIGLQKWDPAGLFESLGRPFCGVPEVNTDTVYEECTGLGLPFPDYYINGGFLIFGREHKRVWELTVKKHPKCGRWLEQGALNLALMHLKIPVCRLPRWFNVVTFRGNVDKYHDSYMHDKAINLHVTSMPSPEELVKIQQQYGLYNSSEPTTVVGNPPETWGYS